MDISTRKQLDALELSEYWIARLDLRAATHCGEILREWCHKGPRLRMCEGGICIECCEKHKCPGSMEVNL